MSYDFNKVLSSSFDEAVENPAFQGVALKFQQRLKHVVKNL
ncbi:MAG: hypothetical protein WBC70_07720 [Candidatus Aminicenantales bacterium]